jgi:hypothetical protein
MPNYCDNGLNIKFESLIDLKHFIFIHFNNKELDFNTIVPEPKTIDECPRKYSLLSEQEKKDAHIVSYEDREWFNWYLWHCDFWGTKWNSCSTDYYIDTKTLTLYVSFTTAWSPAIPIVHKLIDMYPSCEIHFTYYESGMCFAGFIDYESGGIIENQLSPDDGLDYYQFLYDNDYESEDTLTDPDCFNLSVVDGKVKYRKEVK